MVVVGDFVKIAKTVGKSSKPVYFWVILTEVKKEYFKGIVDNEGIFGFPYKSRVQFTEQEIIEKV